MIRMAWLCVCAIGVLLDAQSVHSENAIPVVALKPAVVEGALPLHFTGTVTSRRFAALSPYVDGLVISADVDEGLVPEAVQDVVEEAAEEAVEKASEELVQEGFGVLPAGLRTLDVMQLSLEVLPHLPIPHRPYSRQIRMQVTSKVQAFDLVLEP